MMDRRSLRLGISVALATFAAVPAYADYEYGPFTRIAMLRPHDEEIHQWETAYLRHLKWHADNNETYGWYGYNLWSSDHQRLFVYATFGHSAKSLSNPINPADDEKDTIINLIPHIEFLGNYLFEFLPRASEGNGVPSALARTEFTTVDLKPGTEARFEAALYAARSRLQGETHWYRLVSGAHVPRYIRLRPKKDLEAFFDDRAGAALPPGTASLIESQKVEILSFRPTMSLNVPPPQ